MSNNNSIDKDEISTARVSGRNVIGYRDSLLFVTFIVRGFLSESLIFELLWFVLYTRMENKCRTRTVFNPCHCI